LHGRSTGKRNVVISRQTANAIANGVAPVQATLGLASSVFRHVGWWLDWNTRAWGGDACRHVEDVGLTVEPPATRAA
jgi:hypothetical protein